MKGSTQKTEHKLSRSEIKELFQLQARHNHLRHRLQTPEKWMPRHMMEQPDAKPAEVLGGLRTEATQIWKRIGELTVKGAIPMPQDIPGPDEGLPPLRDRVHAHIAEARQLHSLREGSILLVGDIAVGEPPPTEEPDTVSGLGWPTEFYHLLSLYAYETGADYTEFMHDEWKYEPYISADYGRLDFRTDVKRCDYGRLMHQAALVFKANGAAPFDGLFVWQAKTTLAVPYFLNADEASFTADWLVCEQPNRTRNPWNSEYYSFRGLDVSVSDTWNVSTWSQERTLSGAMAVSEGDGPAVYLGVGVDIEVEDDGRAGTKWDWGSLIVHRPPGYDCWGIEYSYIRME